MKTKSQIQEKLSKLESLLATDDSDSIAYEMKIERAALKWVLS